MTESSASPSRRPQDAPPRRIEKLATLPVFFRMAGRKAVVAGGSEGALWKAELLAASGAHVEVFAGDEAERFAALAADNAFQVRVEPRGWQESDLADAALALGDFEDMDEAEAFRAAAKRAGAVVNLVDKPALCDVQFGSLVNRSPLIVAISTDGAIPVLGQAVRAKIEALLPPGLAQWVETAKSWRPLVKAKNLSFQARRSFWERVAALAMDQAHRAPEEADREAAFARLDDAGETQGRVLLVGAGPGDPDLLTLKALRALQSADVILYDDLVSDAVLALARREARRVGVGKRGRGPSCSQEDINRLIVEEALAGRVVVRLKSGDPAIFGRAGEEIVACQEAGVPVEMIPGVSAVQGAARTLNLSLTHRHHARRFQVLTGHAANGKLPADICWPALADKAVTTALYMPKQTLGLFAQMAVREGLDPATPAVAVFSVSLREEKALRGTIASLPDLVTAEAEDAPCLVLIGWAMGE